MINVLLNNIVKLWRSLNLIHIWPLKIFPKLSRWEVSIISLRLSPTFFRQWRQHRWFHCQEWQPGSVSSPHLSGGNRKATTPWTWEEVAGVSVWSESFTTYWLPCHHKWTQQCESVLLYSIYFTISGFTILTVSSISDFFDSGSVWIDCEPWVHPESAAQILCSGAHRGPAARLSLLYNFFLHHFLYSCCSSGPYKTVGYDRIWGWSSKDWSQEESRRPNPQQKNCRILTLIAELCFSSTLIHHLPDTGFLLTAGRAVGIRDWSWEEGQEQ